MTFNIKFTDAASILFLTFNICKTKKLKRNTYQRKFISFCLVNLNTLLFFCN